MLGPRKLALPKGEFVVSFLLPPRPPRSGDAYLRFIPRTEMDIAVVGAGVSLTLDGEGTITAARVSLGAVAARVLLVPAAAQAIVGSRLDPPAQERLEAAARAACRPIDDKRGTIEFRIQVAGRADAPGGPDRAGPSEGRADGQAPHRGDGERRRGRVPLRDGGDAARRAPRHPAAHGQQGRLRLGRLRRLQRHAGRPAGLLLPRAGLRGRRAARRDDRGHGQGARRSIRCSRSSSSTPRCSAGSARRASSWPARRCSSGIPSRPSTRSATGSPATCAGARATTRS